MIWVLSRHVRTSALCRIPKRKRLVSITLFNYPICRLVTVGYYSSISPPWFLSSSDRHCQSLLSIISHYHKHDYQPWLAIIMDDLLHMTTNHYYTNHHYILLEANIDTGWRISFLLEGCQLRRSMVVSSSVTIILNRKYYPSFLITGDI